MNETDYARMTGRQIRRLCRTGAYTGPTAGVARGFAQANLVIVHSAWAADFESFCRRNPQSCPLLEVTKPGEYALTQIAVGADLRTDLPRYRVFRNGRCVDQPTSITAYWPDPSNDAPCDLVAFLIACSFTFDSALLEAGVPVRHVEQGSNVPMYRTSIDCRPAGPFAGPLIVSMRPMPPRHLLTARAITGAFARVHGAPIHVGDPRAIGIEDLERPDYGDAVGMRPGEVPVFWACGVTPMEAVIHAKPDLAITHDPGHMFVTDVPDQSLRETSP